MTHNTACNIITQQIAMCPLLTSFCNLEVQSKAAKMQSDCINAQTFYQTCVKLWSCWRFLPSLTTCTEKSIFLHLSIKKCHDQQPYSSKTSCRWCWCWPCLVKEQWTDTCLLIPLVKFLKFLKSITGKSKFRITVLSWSRSLSFLHHACKFTLQQLLWRGSFGRWLTTFVILQ